MFKRIVSALCMCLMLSACAANHQGVQTTLNKCGMGYEKFAKFQECSHKSLKVNSSDPNDYYAKSRNEILGEIDALALSVKKKNITQKSAYANLNASLQEKIIEEQQQGQTAGAIAAAMLLGVAVVSCANSGTCGSGQGFSSDNRGCCSWHNGMSGACYAGRVVCNDGQLSPSCTC